MIDPRLAMRLRLLVAGLSRGRGTTVIAMLSIAIGTSVPAAQLHVARDVSRQLTRELRVLGPNLLLVPADDSRTLSWSRAREQLEHEGLTGAPVLVLHARHDSLAVAIAGADLDAMRGLHPGWNLPSQTPSGWIGARLMDRLGVRPGDVLRVRFGAHETRLALPVGPRLESGSDADDQWWIPLERAQALAGLSDRASRVEVRAPGRAADVEALAARLETDGDPRALVLHALSATEAGLLARMERLMLLVTLAALAAAGLCAFGTLTDLALMRRREIALLKSLGATRREIIRQFAAESLAIGLVGGTAGWLIGAVFAQFIGREVFRSSITLDPVVPLIVLGLALLVAAIATVGPVVLALRIEPAAALKGD